MPTYPDTATATDIINQVALEMGLGTSNDPYSSTDANFTQLTALLTKAGRELVRMEDWQNLIRTQTINVLATDAGVYDVPVDYTKIYPDTMWDYTNQRPLQGPMTPQEWQILEGNNVNSIIDMAWMLKANQIELYPNNPVGSAHTVKYNYKSNYWVLDADGSTLKGAIVTGADTPIFNSMLLEAYLKVKFLLAKGFDATAAQDDFNQMMSIIKGEDKSASTLSAGTKRYLPLINPIDNLNNTGYGG